MVYSPPYRSSFHVGSGCGDPETFVQAISDARCVFDMGVSVRKPRWGGGRAGRSSSQFQGPPFGDVAPITEAQARLLCAFFTAPYASGCCINLLFLTPGGGRFQHVSAGHRWWLSWV